jgi:hypothetical protein
MPFFTIEYNLSSLKKAEGQVERAGASLVEVIQSEFRNFGPYLVKMVQAEAPSKTGEFRSGIVSETVNTPQGVTIRLLAPDPLGTFIVMGTKPHKIAARNAKALRFYWTKIGMDTIVPKGGLGFTGVWKGKFFIGKGYVNHPGTKPNDFVGRGWRVSEPELGSILNSVSGSWVKKVVGAYNV